jgi:hypothetical protein
MVLETPVAADGTGYADALAVAERHAPGRRAFAVEGTGSYGAGLTRFLTGSGEQVSRSAGCRSSGRRTRSTLSGPPVLCSLRSGP